MYLVENFFLNRNEPIANSMFSSINFVLLIFTFTFIYVLTSYKDKIKSINPTKIRYITGSIILFNWILRRGSFIFFGVYNYKYHLDIGFCSLTSILFMIYCFTNNKKLFNLVYYLSFCSLLIAILFPSVNYDPNNYRFYSFIIIHHFSFIMIILFSMVNNLEANYKNCLINSLIIIIIYSSICLFNIFVGTDYNSLLSIINSEFLEIKTIQYICENYILSIVFSVALAFGFVNIGYRCLKQLNKI